MPLQQKSCIHAKYKNVNYIILSRQVVLLKYLTEVYRRLLTTLRGPPALRGEFEHTWSNK